MSGTLDLFDTAEKANDILLMVVSMFYHESFISADAFHSSSCLLLMTARCISVHVSHLVLNTMANVLPLTHGPTCLIGLVPNGLLMTCLHTRGQG